MELQFYVGFARGVLWRLSILGSPAVGLSWELEMKECNRGIFSFLKRSNILKIYKSCHIIFFLEMHLASYSQSSEI